MIRALSTVGLLLVALAARGHHAYTGFDTGQMVEVEGTLVTGPHGAVMELLQTRSD